MRLFYLLALCVVSHSFYADTMLAQSESNDDLACNCVLWLRANRVPSLPRGLETLEGKRKIINSTKPTVGSVAVMDIYGDVGHVAYVSKVKADGSIVVEEANYKTCKVTMDRTGKPSDGTFKVLGYFRPGAKPHQPTNPPPVQLPDLNGEWTADGYGGRIRVNIRQIGSKVTATKLSSYSQVPAGQVTWQGTYTSNRFSGKLQISRDSGRDARWVAVVIRVLDKDHITVVQTEKEPESGQLWGPWTFERVR